MLPSHPSNPSVLMNVGKYSAQPALAPCAPPSVPYGGALKPADGEAWTDSDGPAADGRILPLARARVSVALSTTATASANADGSGSGDGWTPTSYPRLEG